MACLGLGGCATRPPGHASAQTVSWVEPQAAPSTRQVQDEQVALARGRAIADAARSFQGASSLVVDGRPYRYDCSGLVEAVFARAGLPSRDRTVEVLFKEAAAADLLHRRLIPTVGDVAFFDATADRDDDNMVNDLLTHVAIVVDVNFETGTITLVHKGSRGVLPIAMNLRSPSLARTGDGVRANDVLVAPGLANPLNRLTGELWYVFGSFWRQMPES